MNINIASPDDLRQLQDKMDSLGNRVESLGEGLGRKATYSVSETAKLLQVSKRTLQRYRDEGFITFTQVGKKIFFTAQDIEIFLRKFKVDPKSRVERRHNVI